MRAVSLVLGVLLLVSCGRAGNGLQWPAHVDSMQGFDDSSSSLAKSYITALNTTLGEDAVALDSSSGSPISIKVVSTFSDSNTAAEQISATSGLKVAGRATVTDNNCTIEIGDFIVSDTNENLLEPVLWHELGHCAGLMHVQPIDQIMSPTTIAWPGYTQDAINTYVSSFLSSAGLPGAK